ncbi:hypothetical protein BGZ81_004374, partial [Podila clonocystis]
MNQSIRQTRSNSASERRAEQQAATDAAIESATNEVRAVAEDLAAQVLSRVQRPNMGQASGFMSPRNSPPAGQGEQDELEELSGLTARDSVASTRAAYSMSPVDVHERLGYDQEQYRSKLWAASRERPDTLEELERQEHERRAAAVAGKGVGGREPLEREVKEEPT